jgi:hypothetical protein
VDHLEHDVREPVILEVAANRVALVGLAAALPR